jgi:transcriptional regulator with XRE-family HTH domain
MLALFNGPQIRALRLRLGMSPTQFAARCGVSAGLVTYWEKETRPLKVSTLIAINEMAREAGIDPAVFVGEKAGKREPAGEKKAGKREPVA